MRRLLIRIDSNARLIGKLSDTPTDIPRSSLTLTNRNASFVMLYYILWYFLLQMDDGFLEENHLLNGFGVDVFDASTGTPIDFLSHVSLSRYTSLTYYTCITFGCVLPGKFRS